MKAVLDASALLACIDADRPECAVALAGLRERAALHAPALAGSEVGHVLQRKRFGVGKEASERAAIHELVFEGLYLVAPDADHWRLSAELSVKHGLSFFDAEYIATAMLGEADLLVTEDRAMRKVALHELGANRALDWADVRKLR